MECVLTAFLFVVVIILISILNDQIRALKKQINELDNRVTALEEDDNRGIISFGQSEWNSATDSTPRMNHQVIVLTDEGRIAFGHVVDKRFIKSYNGWNIPDVAYWRECEYTAEMKQRFN